MTPFRSPSSKPSHAFDDIVIHFTRQVYYDNQHAFQIEIRQAPGYLPGGAFQVDIETRLGAFRQDLIQRITMNQFLYRYETVRPEESNQDLADLGHQLYELLPLSFRQAFPRLIQKVLEKGRGVRLVFQARAGDQADRLLSLPWELLFFQDTRVFLARSPRVLIVRRLLDAIRRSPVQVTPPFNLVHVIAHNPSDPQRYQIDHALQQVEREAIRRAVEPGHYRLIEKPGSIKHVLAALSEAPYHIVHFLGHGEHYTARVGTERGYLRFVGEEGDTQWVTGEQLEHWLGFTPSVQLVVLNACHGGSGAASSIALELAYSGLPNIVAMQSDILQAAARHFVLAFYAELQSGQPVDYAVAAGRSAIAANMPQTLDWCLPVLYTSAGLPEQSSMAKLTESLWQWASSPKSKRQLGTINLTLGILYVVTSLLLFLSGKTLAPPGVHLVNWINGGILVAPLLLTAGIYLFGQLSIPGDWPFSSKATLVARSLGSASLGIGLPTLYGWFLVVLLVALGFWQVLSYAAQIALLALIFVPGLAFGCVLSYSQIIGHGRALVSDAEVELPTFTWSELAPSLVGYILLALPWVALTLGLFIPPPGSLLLGIVLSVSGYQVYRHSN
ncbi:MAG: CHAT domain-containing protein [Thermoflexales bacterium]|nr:CHAT domain-containing protein [Thermoflexales bacterium]